MPDEASTPPADTQAPPSEPVSAPMTEPTPPPEATAPAPEPEQTPTPTQTSAPAEVSEPAPEPAPESAASTPAPEPTPESSSVQDSGGTQPQQTSQPQPATTVIRPTGDLVAANAKIQATKRKRLDKIMAAIEGKGPTTLKLRRVNAITNDEVEKLLRVSDATATRYLDTLEKEGRVRQEGKTGRSVVYVRI